MTEEKPIEKRGGFGRRREDTEVIVARGKFAIQLKKIQRVAIGSLMVSLIGLAALVFAIDSLMEIDQQRVDSRLENCLLLKELVRVSTPPGEGKAAQAFIDKTPLKNCHTYAHHVSIKAFTKKKGRR